MSSPVVPEWRLLYVQSRDLLLAVNGEASHGTAPLGWDICWLTTRRHDEPMAGPHRRYSYPGRGLGVILNRDTTAVREGVSNILGLGVPILCIWVAVRSSRCTQCYDAMLVKYPHFRQSVACVRVVGFTPDVNGGILSSKKDSRVASHFGRILDNLGRHTAGIEIRDVGAIRGGHPSPILFPTVESTH